jgi:ABC transport system ATP-binding/permease protein
VSGDDVEVTLRAQGGAKPTAAPEVLLHSRSELDRIALIFDGERVPIPEQGLLIGSGSDCDLRITSDFVAPHHARITTANGRAWINDLGSGAATYLNGAHFAERARELSGGDSIAVGDEILYFVQTARHELPPVELVTAESRLQMDRNEIRLGRAGSNDVVLDHPRVSPVHAVITAGQSGARIKDVSKGGEGVRVNGSVISRAFIKTGDEIAIGPYRFVFDGAMLQQRLMRSGLRLDAYAIAKTVTDKVLLHPLNLTILPGEFVGIIGPSGAGKSTLMKALCGVHAVTDGAIMLDGEPVGARLPDLGYVPQQEIVHSLLSTSEALVYAAELRLPQDTRPQDRETAVLRALNEVGLDEHAHTRIDQLSGGQRKRAGVATELLSQPGMLFLDEPTSGLDPGLEARLMQLFKNLSDAGRATVVVTHATKSLQLCDKIVVMGAGGHLCFCGSPNDALGFFRVSDFDEIYTALEDRPAEEWAAAYGSSEHSRVTPVAAYVGARRDSANRPVTHQATTLIRRRIRTFARDQRNLWILAGQVPIIAILLVVLFHQNIFERFAPGRAGTSAQLLFLLVTVSLWFGSISSCRELVKERPLAAREAAVGVRLSSYLFSKAVVLGLVTGLQTLCLTLIVVIARPLHEPVDRVALDMFILLLTTWSGVGMGLIVSACVSSEDQATSFVPLLLIPQLLFSGSLVAVHQMGIVLQVLSKGIVGQWAFSALGNGIDMNQRIHDDPVFRTVSQYGTKFFGTPVELSLLVIVGFLVLNGALLAYVVPRTTQEN